MGSSKRLSHSSTVTRVNYPCRIVGGVEITAASQDEGLIHGVLQAVVGVLGDAVFVALAVIDAGGAETVVIQQRGVIVV